MSINVSKISNLGLFSKCQSKLNKIGKMTLENVSKADKDTRQFLREFSPARLKELAQMNCFAADKVKQVLDSKYGKNNYVLVAIGRSVSSIAETLESMGVDIKIIPMSGLRRRYVDDIPKKDLDTYKTFLVQKGLSKADLNKNKDKKYILMDYAYYGRTLERATELLKKDEMLGNAPNLVSMRINDILGEDYDTKQFRILFKFNRFKDYSYVGKLHVDNLDKVYEQCSPDRVKEYQGNITKGIRKLFWFNVFDSLNMQNYKNINPIKELKALYAHQMSPKAVQNYLKREFEKDMNIINSLTNKK